MKKQSDKGFAAASVLTAGLASVCCIGPVVAAMLGFGAFGASAAFESARLYLLAATAVLLGTASYLSYRKSSAAGCADGSCVQAGQRRQRVILWIAAAVAIPLAAFPYHAGLVTGDGGAPAEATASETALVVFEVAGMTCEQCASGTEATLGREQGVASAEVDYEKKTARIRYVPGIVSPERLAARIEQLGFHAEAERMEVDDSRALLP